MRVAVTQFATSLNAEENLATCVRIINEAAVCEPSLIVLPELCNTLFFNTSFDYNKPCYIDHNQAWDEALFIDGIFLQNIAEQAKKHSCYIVLNVTLRRDTSRDHKNAEVKSKISITSCLFSPLGKLIHQADKQVLARHESAFFISADHTSEVIETKFGKLGFLVGDDDVTFEASRNLTLSGAQLLCHSMNSSVLDQSNIHEPARACENTVFLASSNKVGSLVQVQNTSQTHIVGVGQSQIVSPDGNVLAKIDHNREGFVFADIELVKANSKFRPDGTDFIKQLRPELYQMLSQQMKPDNNKVPATANVAIFATYKSNEQAIDDVCFYIENNLSDIIQLPELFFIDDKTILNNIEQRTKIEYLSKRLINQISAELRPFQYVCTSLIIEGIHQAAIISAQGVFATQQQLHFCERYKWTELGEEVNIIELPLEQGNIKVAILTADDANIPEIVNIVALNHINVLLVPFDIQSPCEVEYSLISRAAEHRICIVAASREKNFTHNFVDQLVTYNGSNNLSNYNNQNLFNKNKVKSRKSTGFIANLTADPALRSAQLSQGKLLKFNGYINQPIVKYQHGKITKAVIYPIAACYKNRAKN